MSVSARSYIAAGLAVLTAGVIAIPTSVGAPAPLSASVQKEQVALLAAARSFTAPVASPLGFLVLAPPHAAAPTNSTRGAVITASPTAAPAAAAPAAQAALVGFPGIQDAIINAYNVINPWIDYGVNLAQYAVGWIPVASFFAPQIGIFYYSLIEPIMTSAVYNTAYVLGGSIGLVQGISNVINDSINAGIGFVNAEISWALSFLPPLPPLPFAAAQTTALKVAAEPAAQATTEAADGTGAAKHEPGVATAAEPTAAEATSAEPTAKPAAEPAEPEATKSPTEPATPKPEAEPVKKPEATTTASSDGVAAQGEVRGGTQSATDEKKPDDKTPASKPDDKGVKGDADTASTASKPAESSPSGTKTDAKDGNKSGDSDKSVGSAQGA
jgi:hypothetical protein